DANVACDPLPMDAPSYYSSRSQSARTFGQGTLGRACFNPGYQSTTTSGSSTTLSVPGYNPAVRDYVLRFSDSQGNRVFTDEEINALTGCVGCNTTSFNGGTRNFQEVQLGMGYVPVAPGDDPTTAGLNE